MVGEKDDYCEVIINPAKMAPEYSVAILETLTASLEMLMWEAEGNDEYLMVKMDR